MKYDLTPEDINKLDGVSFIINQPRPVNERLKRFVDKYENDKDRDVKRTDKIRYFFSKRNVTFGELGLFLGVHPSSIGIQSSVKTNTLIAYLMDTPVNELYVQPSKKRSSSFHARETKFANLVKNLLKLADEIENNC